MTNYNWTKLIAATCEAAGWEHWVNWDYGPKRPSTDMNGPGRHRRLSEHSLNDVAAVQEKAGVRCIQIRKWINCYEVRWLYIDDIPSAEARNVIAPTRVEAEWLATAKALGVNPEYYKED